MQQPKWGGMLASHMPGRLKAKRSAAAGIAVAAALSATVVLASPSQAMAAARPAPPAAQLASQHGYAAAASVTTRNVVTPDLAVGRTGTHVWIIASYADIASRAIWSAVVACVAYNPELWDVCELAGDRLSELAQGWGRASNHGVWAAVYWWPPHYTVGRW